jgi:hypothetical protein
VYTNPSRTLDFYAVVIISYSGLGRLIAYSKSATRSLGERVQQVVDDHGGLVTNITSSLEQWTERSQFMLQIPTCSTEKSKLLL